MKSSWIGSLVACLVVFLTPLESLSGTLTSLAAFGGGDGWLAPGEGGYAYLGTGNLERGMAYNAATGNLVLVSRSALGNGLRLLNGTTGADVGALNQGSGIISGGTFTTNVVAVSPSGVIYVSNLASPVSATYKVYQWTSEAASAPTVAYSSTTITAGRLGDNIDLIGDGTSTLVLAGESNSAGSGARNGYAVLSTADGSNFSGSLVTFVGTPPNGGDFRLGMTFTDADTVLGTATVGSGATPMRVTDFSGTAGTLAGSAALTSTSERVLDYAVVAGVPVLASIDTASSVVRVYDLSNPLAPVLLATGNNTSGTLASNGNSSGSIKWGAISGVTATLYAMSTNQGIQAFTFEIPEPTSALLMVFGVAFVAIRRRTK